MKLFDLKNLGKLEEAKFIERPNRFVGICNINGDIKRCHIADSGRLKEILTKGRELLVVKNPSGMKTDYKVVAAKMEDGWILLNTSFHSEIGRKAIEKGVLGFIPKKIKSEVKFGSSRLDYLIDDKVFVELKGSNLLIDGKCLFPDAPTSRGKRHVEELMEAVEKGYEAIILFMLLRKCKCFEPNSRLDPDFADVFYKALKKGVEFVAFQVEIDNEFNINLKENIPLCKR